MSRGWTPFRAYQSTTTLKHQSARSIDKGTVRLLLLPVTVVGDLQSELEIPLFF